LVTIVLGSEISREAHPKPAPTLSDSGRSNASSPDATSLARSLGSLVVTRRDDQGRSGAARLAADKDDAAHLREAAVERAGRGES
jgi:hypothetical protein